MSELKIGQHIDMEYGGSAKILKKLGSGGQGTVYLVDFNGGHYALKWYNIDKIREPEAFRKNLENNIKDGAPSDKFLWPQYLSKAGAYNSFGYIMDLRPEGYDSFVDILNMYRLETVTDETGAEKVVRAKVQFKSLDALVTAAANIVNAFRQLHRAGKSYQDLNDGGFFIDVRTGDVVVCDCDNIAPEGYNFGIGGKPGYMAPEIVRGIAKPDVQTDKYSLAVVLFKLLFRGDPLEGEKVVRSVCLTEMAELKHYGRDAVFVFDPNNETNRPVRGIHDNVIKLWGIYPPYIKEAFTYSFTVGISEPRKRIIENEWQKLFIRLRADIIPCVCGKTTYASMFGVLEDGTYKCMKCGTEYFALKFSNKDYTIPLYQRCKLYKCDTSRSSDDFMTVTGEVVENKVSRGVFGIKNLSGDIWKAKMPDGSLRNIPPNGGFPLWKGLEIDFGNDITAKIGR